MTYHPDGDELGLFKAEAVERGYAVRGFSPTIQVDEGPMPVLVVDQVKNTNTNTNTKYTCDTD